MKEELGRRIGVNKTVVGKLSRQTGVRRSPVLASLLLSAMCFFLVWLPQGAKAAPSVLQDIKITTKAGAIHVDFDLGVPLNYVKHFPQAVGEILQIQLSVTTELNREIHKEIRQGGDLAPPPGNEQLLIYVTYEEGVPGGPYLTLRFAKPVSFSVEAGDNPSKLTVVIRDDQEKTQEEREEVADASSPTPEVASEGLEISIKTLQEQVFNQAEKSEKKLDQKVAERNQQQKSTAVRRKKPANVAKNKVDVGQLLAKARQALTFGDNSGAIQLLRSIAAMPENEHTQDARELVGLALERSNQIPRAKFEYKKYLKIYKKGEGPVRVQQRLTALQSIISDKRKKLRRSTRSKKGSNYSVFGRWSQAYSTRFQQRRPENDDDVAEDIVLTRRTDSHLTIRGRYRTEERNVQAVFTGNHSYDLIDSTETEQRISSLYLDYDAFKDGYYTILGRQRVRNSGIFGRFDGVIGGYDVLPWMRTNVFFGTPVEFNDDRDLDRRFWGLKLDIGKRNDPVNINVYLVDQTVDGFNDRNAVGAGFRYSDKEHTVFGLLDYDVLFNEVNLFNVRWGWKYFEKSRLNLSFNRRRLLFLTSALNSQPLGTSMSTLVSEFGEDDVRQLAEDRTSESDTITIGNNYQFNRDTQLNVDLSIFSSSGTVDRLDIARPVGCIRDNGTSGIDSAACSIKPVFGAPGTSNQYTLSAQMIAGNLFAERDLYVFGLRLSSFDSYDDITLFSNARLPPINRWKPRPRLNLSYRDITEGQFLGTRIAIGPSVKVDYAWKKEWVFEFELGVEFVEYSNVNIDDEVRQNIRIGYNYTF
ncbi:MAG: hypothetical protein GXP08_16555 [Gammaproteobacteria bacterium]|nr:hypothetical protein [Gammaproteobacteria bacterium]